jgi:hypothetical protein
MEKYIGSIFIAAIVLIWWLLIFLDKKRIQKSAERLGYTNVKVTWFPFTPSAFFSRGNHYYVTYIGLDKEHHYNYCITSLLTGIYWRDERDVYTGSNFLLAIIIFLLLFLGLYQVIVVVIQWLR